MIRGLIVLFGLVAFAWLLEIGDALIPGHWLDNQGIRPHTISGLWGILFAPFLLTWIFSGFLSMDDGSLFAHSDALFRTLHKLDFEPLTSHPELRASLIVALCLCGFAFSLTGVVLGWRRLRAA